MNKKLSNIMAVRDVGKQIKAGMKATWVTTAELARQTGINQTMLHGVLANKVKLPTKYAEPMANVLPLNKAKFRDAVVKQYKPR